MTFGTKNKNQQIQESCSRQDARDFSQQRWRGFSGKISACEGDGDQQEKNGHVDIADRAQPG
ncbi:MAG TPA: hypothetical protein IGS52_13265 [Oscillatoriaceae cyanobacterium M33_DOE_052]|uniref:Uncharacterized protein n=1 Tax=Planktothricoides sp. SpSt-374 TaxID=2282167 RepID=A0A7C3ZWU4_9CYAN|nr:hypothetical protein [Oscillatoriaceae cyanobacterium M33_DOE_052]